MMEDAKVARLWSDFHRLSEEHKHLILKVTEIIARQEIAGADSGSGTGSHIPETNTHKERK
jgi:hypothetical protein